MPKVGKFIGKATNDCGDDSCWDELSFKMAYYMKDKSLWNAKVENFGWDNLSGTKEGIKATCGGQILMAILPNTSCSFEVYRYGRYGFAVNNAHHDKPTGGEWYYITPAKG